MPFLIIPLCTIRSATGNTVDNFKYKLSAVVVPVSRPVRPSLHKKGVVLSTISASQPSATESLSSPSAMTETISASTSVSM